MGHRIELSDIECAMTKIEGVQRCCCLYENETIIACYLGSKERRELIRELKKELPSFMIPGSFLALEQFPLTKNGKIDRNALKQQLEVEAC